MIYTESELGTQSIISLLECLPTIEREWVEHNAFSIPLMEFKNVSDTYFVRYSDLESLAECQDISIHEAAREVQDANFLKDDNFVIAMEEWRPIANPSIVDEFKNVILIKEMNTPIYRICETCMNLFMETHDMEFVDIFLEADNVDAQTLRVKRMQEDIDKMETQLRGMKQGDPAYARLNKQLIQRKQKLAANQATLQHLTNQKANLGAVKSGYKASGVGSNNPPTAAQAPADAGGEQQGWWARKWAAFKNWMNGLGNNGDQQSSWFTNMINNVKQKLGFNNSGGSSTPAAGQAPQAAAPAQPPSAGQQLAAQANSAIASATDKGVNKAVDVISNFAKDHLGVDISDTAKAFGGAAKQAINTKGQSLTQQGAEKIDQAVSGS